jgi:thiol-disulfide isomerase/thioredoxin
MKNSIFSIILAFISLLTAVFFVKYSWFVILGYAFFVFIIYDKNKSIFKNILIINLPFFVFLVLPLIFDNFVFDVFNYKSPNSKQILRFIVLYSQICIVACLFIRINRIKGLIYVLTLFVIVFIGFKGWQLQSFFAGIGFLLLCTFIKLPNHYSKIKKFAWFYLPVFFLFTLNPFWEPLFTGNEFEMIRIHMFPMDFSVLLGILIGLSINNTSMLRKIVFLSISIVFFAAYAYYGYWNWRAYAEKYRGKQITMPEIQLTTLDNDTIRISNPKGNVLVFNFWSTYCGACIKEFPEIEKLHKEYEDNSKVSFYSVNIPARRDTEELIIQRTKNFSTPVYFGDSTLIKNLSLSGFPTLIIIKDSVVQYSGLPFFEKHNYYNVNYQVNRMLNQKD